jgi:hypothetical protein
MREKSKKQLPLMHLSSDHPQARELEAISRILDAFRYTGSAPFGCPGINLRGSSIFKIFILSKIDLNRSEGLRLVA